jgi:hypothetical protein
VGSVKEVALAEVPVNLAQAKVLANPVVPAAKVATVVVVAQAAAVPEAIPRRSVISVPYLTSTAKRSSS